MSLFRQVGKRLLRYFLAGIFAVLPLVVTCAVVIWVAGFLQGYIGPATPVGRGISELGFRVTAGGKAWSYVFGWAFVLGTIFLLGVAVEMGARRMMQTLVDAVLNRVPVVGSIYNTSKQLVSMLDRQDQADLKGMSVVHCTFGGQHGVGFLALLVSPQVYRIGERDCQIVIVPTAPVPFGGGLLFVPKGSILPADMSVDGLMSIYVSMGVTADGFMGEAIVPKQ
jgi:uncharacterized membrane protein